MVDYGRLKLIVGPRNFGTPFFMQIILWCFVKGKKTAFESLIQLIREYSDVLFRRHGFLQLIIFFTTWFKNILRSFAFYK